MKQYQDLLDNIMNNGHDRMDRTGVGTRALFCEKMVFDMADGFPAITTKNLAFNQVKGELIGFIHGCTTNEEFEALGCNVWRPNAEADYWLNSPHHNGVEGYLGPIYGSQWRGWPDDDGLPIDQLADVIKRIKTNPTDRRLIVSAWNVADLPLMALPPCHMTFQFFVRDCFLDMMMLQRSCDTFLGVPFNIASYSILLHMVAQVTGLAPGIFSHVLNDVHIYKNHFDQVGEQLTREPYQLPTLYLNPNIESIDDFMPDDVELIDYKHHPAIKGDMAV